jgi:hypothetical protein
MADSFSEFPTSGAVRPFAWLGTCHSTHTHTSSTTSCPKECLLRWTGGLCSSFGGTRGSIRRSILWNLSRRSHDTCWSVQVCILQTIKVGTPNVYYVLAYLWTSNMFIVSLVSFTGRIKPLCTRPLRNSQFHSSKAGSTITNSTGIVSITLVWQAVVKCEWFY